MAYTAANSREIGDRFEVPEQYAGYLIYDPLGTKIGKVKKLFANGKSEPEYVMVSTGPFGLKSILIPVQNVAVDHDRQTLVLQ